MAAGGSSNRVVVHDTADSQVTQQFALPEVRSCLATGRRGTLASWHTN